MSAGLPESAAACAACMAADSALGSSWEAGGWLRQRALGAALFFACSPSCSLACCICCAAGYLTLAEVFTYGALCGSINLLLWATVGGAWWKLLGIF